MKRLRPVLLVVLALLLTGATSGWHCGTIQAKNQTITFPGGTITGLTRTSVCAEAGVNPVLATYGLELLTG